MDFEGTGKVTETYRGGVSQQAKGAEDESTCFWDILADKEVGSPQEKAFLFFQGQREGALRRCRKKERPGPSPEELHQLWKAERARRRRRAEYLLMLEESAGNRKFQQQENTRAYIYGSIARTGGTASYEASLLMRPIRKNRLSKI